MHYTERGSVLAQLLFAGAAGAGAGARAQTTGRDQNYTIDASPKSMAALRFDMLQSDKGSYFNFDAFYGFPLGNKRLPWILDFGVNVGALTGPDIQSEAGYFGLFLGLVAPVTRFAQIEAKLAGLLVEPYWNAELHGVVNLGNRFYARGGVVVFQGTSYMLGAGVKL